MAYTEEEKEFIEKTIRQNLKVLAAMKGKSLARVCREIGHNGRNLARPSTALIMRLCRSLGCTPNDLLLRKEGVVYGDG